LSHLFAGLQDSLGSRLGKEVFLVSVSVDPHTDTPARLKEHGKKYGAKPGWILLTGDKKNVDAVLTGLGSYSPDFRNHPIRILVGDARTGKWTGFYGLASPKDIMNRVNELSTARKNGERTL
jgi:protein SCO1/2